MKNFPVHGQNNYLLLKKLKNQNVAHPRFVVICKIQAIALKWWKQHINSIIYIDSSRLENSFTNFLYLALHSIQHHIALQCPDSLIVQIIFFTEFCFFWTINEYVLPARAGSTLHYSTVYYQVVLGLFIFILVFIIII